MSGELLPHASGLFWNRYKGRATVSHNGAVSGFQADVVHFPKEHLSVICLCNRGDVDAASLSRRIADIYLKPRPGSLIATKSQVTRSQLPADLSGKWQSRQGFILSTKVEGGHLIASIAGETHLMSANSEPGVFSTEADTLRLFLRRRGPDAVDLGWEGDRPNAFQRLRPAAVDNPELGTYAGRFVNEELGITWDLILADDSLLITTAAGWRIPLAEAAQDRFEVGPYLLEFDRGSAGISGFRLHRERLWSLAFERKTSVVPGRK